MLNLTSIITAGSCINGFPISHAISLCKVFSHIFCNIFLTYGNLFKKYQVWGFVLIYNNII